MSSLLLTLSDCFLIILLIKFLFDIAKFLPPGFYLFLIGALPFLLGLGWHAASEVTPRFSVGRILRSGISIVGLGIFLMTISYYQSYYSMLIIALILYSIGRWLERWLRRFDWLRMW